MPGATQRLQWELLPVAVQEYPKPTNLHLQIRPAREGQGACQVVARHACPAVLVSRQHERPSAVQSDGQFRVDACLGEVAGAARDGDAVEPSLVSAERGYQPVGRVLDAVVDAVDDAGAAVGYGGRSRVGVVAGLEASRQDRALLFLSAVVAERERESGIRVYNYIHRAPVRIADGQSCVVHASHGW